MGEKAFIYGSPLRTNSSGCISLEDVAEMVGLCGVFFADGCDVRLYDNLVGIRQPDVLLLFFGVGEAFSTTLTLEELEVCVEGVGYC